MEPLQASHRCACRGVTPGCQGDTGSSTHAVQPVQLAEQADDDFQSMCPGAAPSAMIYDS